MDWSISHALNHFFATHDGVEDPVLAYVNAAEALFLLLLAALFVFARGFARRPARRGVVAAGASAALALAVAQLLSHIVDRPRPFVEHAGGVHLFAPHAADPGFPSDHATAAFAIAVAILLRSRRWGLVTLAMAAVLALGRVAMGVHYPTDVIAGAALGSACALALWQPPIRRPLHALADRASAMWEGGVSALRLRLGLGGR
jgi:undecaprenyl-diphosphatase